MNSGSPPECGSPYLSVDPAPAAPAGTSMPQLRATLLDEHAPIFERYRALFSLRNRVRTLHSTSDASLSETVLYTVLPQMQVCNELHCVWFPYACGVRVQSSAIHACRGALKPSVRWRDAWTARAHCSSMKWHTCWVKCRTLPHSTALSELSQSMMGACLLECTMPDSQNGAKAASNAEKAPCTNLPACLGMTKHQGRPAVRPGRTRRG